MKQKMPSADSRFDLRRDVTAILARDGNRLRFVSAILIVATASLPYLLLLQLVGVLLSLDGVTDSGAALIGSGAAALLFFLTVFLTLPLASGLFYLAERMEEGEETVLADVFYAFSGRAAYRRALRAGLCWALPLAVLIAVPQGMIAGLAGGAGNRILRLVLVALAAVAADFLLFVLLLGGFGRIFKTFRRDRGQSCTGRSARRVGLWYWGNFLPYLILSVLSLLIYLLADVLPRMLISYFRLWRMLTDGVTTDDVSIGG